MADQMSRRRAALVNIQGGEVVVPGAGLSIMVGKYDGKSVVVLSDPNAATWVLSPEEAHRLADGIHEAAKQAGLGRIGPAGGA